jgi:5-methylcytosine-specific restriction endonuclease McrA
MTAGVAVDSPALASSVLMLNRLYMAVRVISAKRALTLLYREQVEVVSVENGAYSSYDFDSWVEVSQAKQRFEPHKHDWVSTVRFQVAVPRVVRLLGYDRLPRAQVKLNRRNLFARDRNRCQYCGKKFATTDLSIDHIIPRSQGGKNTWENIVCACIRCNTRKGGRTPEQAGMKLIQPAIKPRRSPVLTIKLSDSRYSSWKQFLDFAYWNVELK